MYILKFYQNLSFAKKILLYVASTSFFSLILASLAFITYDTYSVRNILVENILTNAKVIGATSSSALAFHDSAFASKVLTGLKEESRVVAACIYLENGNIFARYVRGSAKYDFPKNRSTSSQQFEGEYLDIFSPILFETSHIGTLYIRSDLNELSQRKTRYILIVITVMLLSLLAALFASNMFHRIISRPVLELVKISKKISKEQDYSYRVSKYYDDELGDLIENFNEMLQQIQNQDLSLKEKKKELESIIQEAPNPIILHNYEGDIIMMNKAWTDLSGYTKEDIPTINDWIETVYKDVNTKTLAKKHMAGLYDITSKVNEGTVTFFTKNNTEVVWQFSTAPLGVTDGKRTVISSAMDITELKQKEEMMINQSRQAAMGDMIAMIAHQWRQPITVIAMEANNIKIDIELEEEITTEKLQKMAESISEQTQQLSQTIDDFRNFFKPNQEKVQTTVGSVLESTLKIVGKSMENNNIAVMIENRSETEILTYPNQLLQVLLNLLGNAKDILLYKEVSDAKITITIDETKDSIVTKICDNGGGIPENAIKRLGEPYFTTKEKSGTGLGLYMSIKIVEKHLNGSLTWENKDKGACFIVTLTKE